MPRGHIPQWWLNYCAGSIQSPQGLVQRSFSERFASDPPDTTHFRFSGSPVPDRDKRAEYRLRWERGFFQDGISIQHSRADWRWCHPVLMQFAGDFIALAKRQDIPLYVGKAFSPVSVNDAADKAHFDGLAITIRHARYHDMLLADEWLLLDALAIRVVPKGCDGWLHCSRERGVMPGFYYFSGLAPVDRSIVVEDDRPMGPVRLGPSALCRSWSKPKASE